MHDIIAIEYDITPNIANMLKLGQDLADMTNRAETLAVQLATANEARQQLQDALHVRDTQLSAVTKRMKEANQYALGMEAAANAATQHAEAADQQLMVYRVLLTQAMMMSAAESARLDDLQDFANEYFESIFDTALQSGAFVEAQCGSVGILRVAEQLNVVLEEE